MFVLRLQQEHHRVRFKTLRNGPSSAFGSPIKAGLHFGARESTALPIRWGRSECQPKSCSAWTPEEIWIGAC